MKYKSFINILLKISIIIICKTKRINIKDGYRTRGFENRYREGAFETCNFHVFVTLVAGGILKEGLLAGGIYTTKKDCIKAYLKTFLGFISGKKHSTLHIRTWPEIRNDVSFNHYNKYQIYSRMIIL